MFSSETAYRLGEFVLVEHNRVLLTWLLQSPMGMQQSGRCYVVGDILVILPCHQRNPGYLRLEYSINLRKLPLWRKTTFYCFAHSLHHVMGGRALTAEMIEQLAVNAFESAVLKDTEPGAFRLGRYKIIADNKHEITWQALGLDNKLESGLCSINSGILMLESGKQERGQAAIKSFYGELRSLPLWNKTTTWVFSGAVKYCGTPKLDKTVSETQWKSKYAKILIGEKYPINLLKKSEQEQYSKLSLSGKKYDKIKWDLIVRSTNDKIKKSLVTLDKMASYLNGKINYIETKWNIMKYRRKKSS